MRPVLFEQAELLPLVGDQESRWRMAVRAHLQRSSPTQTQRGASQRDTPCSARVAASSQPASQPASQQPASHQVEAMESYSMYLGTCYCSILEYIRKYMYVVVDGYR